MDESETLLVHGYADWGLYHRSSSGIRGVVCCYGWCWTVSTLYYSYYFILCSLIDTNHGSAFKFLPVLGKYVADCFEDRAPGELRQKWKLKTPTDGSGAVNMAGDGSRGGPPLRKLSVQEQSKL